MPVVALAAVGGVAGATVVQAGQHDYAYWSGSYATTANGTHEFAQGYDYLVNNHAYFPYSPTAPTIYCAANDTSGAQYANYTQGNPGCAHPYGGSNRLKAKLYVTGSSTGSATTHGVISCSSSYNSGICTGS